MATWYRTGGSYRVDIEELEVVRETAKQVVYEQDTRMLGSGRKTITELREAKVGNYHQWFKTKDAAIDHLLTKRTIAVEQARKRYEHAIEALDSIRRKYP